VSHFSGDLGRLVVFSEKAYISRRTHSNEKQFEEEEHMPVLTTITVVGLVVLVGLVWLFMRTRQQDLIADIMAKRKASSKLVCRADYVEGLEKMAVALSLTENAIYYQNPDMDASFDLKDIEEIEYDDELATGRGVPHDCRALRLRGRLVGAMSGERRHPLLAVGLL